MPGVKGIGEKGAVKLLEEYVSLDGIYRHLDSLSKGLKAKLEEGRESAYLSKRLVELKSDVFTLETFDSPDFLVSTIDYQGAVDVFRRHNCMSLAKTASAMATKEGGGVVLMKRRRTRRIPTTKMEERWRTSPRTRAFLDLGITRC